MLTYFTIPNATSSLSGISEWSNSWFSEFFPFILIPVGITVAILLIMFLVNLIHGGILHFTDNRPGVHDQNDFDFYRSMWKEHYKK